MLVVDGLERALLNSTTGETHIRCPEEMTGTFFTEVSVVPRSRLLTASWWNLTLVKFWRCPFFLVAKVKRSMMLTSVLSSGTFRTCCSGLCRYISLLSFVLNISFTYQQQWSCLVSWLHLSRSLRASAASAWLNSHVSRNALLQVGLARRLHFILRRACLDTLMHEFVSCSLITATA